MTAKPRFLKPKGRNKSRNSKKLVEEQTTTPAPMTVWLEKYHQQPLHQKSENNNVMESPLQSSFTIETYPLLYLEVSIKDGLIVPLLIFRKDNIDDKVGEFARLHKLDVMKHSKLQATVLLKMRALENFVPESRELSTSEIRDSTN